MNRINIIIANKDINKIEYIVNKIINKGNNFKTYVATTNNEIMDIIAKNQINAIITSKSVRMLSNKIQIPIFNAIEEKNEIQQIKRFLERINEKVCAENRVRSDIYRELSLLGYNFKLKGTQYLLDSIIYIYKSGKLELVDNLEKNVYKYIAVKNNKTLVNIKTNIVKATNNVYINQDREKLYKYFSIDIKITPKLVISTILNKLIMQ